MENGTFIYVYRKFKYWSWFKDSTMVHLFIYLLLEANHSDKYYRGKFIKRGQLRVSRRELARETGITEQKIRTALNRLKLTQEITLEITQYDHIITVCKYDEYQYYMKPANPIVNPADNPQLTHDQPAVNPELTHDQPAANPHTNKDNTDNKEKNVNNLLEQKGDETASAVSGVVSEKDLKNGFEKSKKNDGVPRKKAGRPPAEIERFDAWLEQEDFRGAWAAWLAMRRSIRKPASSDTQRLCMDELKKFSSDSKEKAIEIVKKSIRNNWADFFAINNPKQGKNGTKSFNADTRAGGREMDYDKPW